MKRLLFVLQFALFSHVVGLSLNERNELSRKFKYYFPSVRPSGPENIVSGRNGSFFSISTEISLLSSSLRSRSVFVDTVVMFSWTDDRLILRELTDKVELPSEFEAWSPRARTFPQSQSQSLFLSPATGILNWYHRVKDTVACNSDVWKHPFQTYQCAFVIESIGSEMLTVTNLRDLRPETQKDQIGVELVGFPSASFHLIFANEWQSAILSVYLPSILVLSLVFFAQWKRRKVQVLVSTAALVCLLVLLSAGRAEPGANMLDLWLSGCFLHSAFLLAVDLILPARRVRYSLMVPVEQPERPPLNILTKASLPEKGLRGVLSRFANRTLGISREPSTSSELVSACASEIPMQRHVTKATLGERKRLALLAIAASFMAFMFIYLLLVLTID